MVETLAFVGVFVGVGLGAAAAFDAVLAPVSAVPVYSPRMHGDPDAPVWLVDGYNVVSVGLLAGVSREGWWRAERRRELLERIAAFDDARAQVWVVFDGPHPSDEQVGAARAVFADSADAWLLERVREAPDPSRLTVVTADRRLAARARRRGAAVATPGAFLARCPTPAATGAAQATSTST